MEGGRASGRDDGESDGGGGWRDNDPPPSFDGEPENFKMFFREMKLWEHETEIPKRKHGAKLLRALRGPQGHGQRDPSGADSG